MNRHSKIFKKIKDDYLKDNLMMLGWCRRILENLGKKKKQQKLVKNQILISNQLSPADLLSYSKLKLSGLVSIWEVQRDTLQLSQDLYLFPQLLELKIF